MPQIYYDASPGVLEFVLPSGLASLCGVQYVLYYCHGGGAPRLQYVALHAMNDTVHRSLITVHRYTPNNPDWPPTPPAPMQPLGRNTATIMRANKNPVNKVDKQLAS